MPAKDSLLLNCATLSFSVDAITALHPGIGCGIFRLEQMIKFDSITPVVLGAGSCVMFLPSQFSTIMYSFFISPIHFKVSI